MAGPMRDTFRDVAKTLAGIRAGAGGSATRPPSAAEIDDVIRAFIADLPRSFSIVVPGDHSGGISYNRLLLVLAEQGRDFLQTTVQLIQAVRGALRREFAGARSLPTRGEMRRVAGPVMLEHVEKRFERGNGDIRVTPLTPAYRARKAAMGRGGQPIGVASGELRAAFSRRAEIRWKD